MAELRAQGGMEAPTKGRSCLASSACMHASGFLQKSSGRSK